MLLPCPGRLLDLTDPVVMGILNTTPDSFSDAGRFATLEAALEQGRAMAAEGAVIIDVGGESTRPGARPVRVDDELARVIPVIRELAAELTTVISIDTRKPEVMEAAVAAGASMINDVNGLRAPGALAAAAALGVPVCVMHMQGEPGTMQTRPVYDDVVEEVYEFLAERIEACLAAGLREDQVIVDPGFGFGKTVAHNLRLMHGLERFAGLGVPLLVGVSRKSMIGTLLDRPVEGRLHGSLALAAIAAMKGARVLRAHDVGPTVDVLRLTTAVARAEPDNRG